MAMIPCLPMASMAETLEFYQVLGFRVTQQQTAPSLYAATERGPLQLHFFGLKGLTPEKGYSTCLALVPEVEQLHATFAEALRGKYGRVPTAGFPRISRMKKGQSRFTVVDMNGNSVIYIRRGAPDDYDEGASENVSQTPLGKALRMAARLRDFKNDDAAAAKVLQVALKKHAGDPVERAKLIAALEEITLAMGGPPRPR